MIVEPMALPFLGCLGCSSWGVSVCGGDSSCVQTLAGKGFQSSLHRTLSSLSLKSLSCHLCSSGCKPAAPTSSWWLQGTPHRHCRSSCSRWWQHCRLPGTLQLPLARGVPAVGSWTHLLPGSGTAAAGSRQRPVLLCRALHVQQPRLCQPVRADRPGSSVGAQLYMWGLRRGPLLWAPLSACCLEAAQAGMCSIGSGSRYVKHNVNNITACHQSQGSLALYL
jgi:hypothetical protein